MLRPMSYGVLWAARPTSNGCGWPWTAPAARSWPCTWASVGPAEQLVCGKPCPRPIASGPPFTPMIGKPTKALSLPSNTAPLSRKKTLITLSGSFAPCVNGPPGWCEKACLSPKNSNGTSMPSAFLLPITTYHYKFRTTKLSSWKDLVGLPFPFQEWER